MKNIFKVLLSTLCAAVIAFPVFGMTACTEDDSTNSGNGGGAGNTEFVDYVSQLELDMKSNTKKQEVTVKMYIDGDTTHFNPVKDSTLTHYNEADFAETDGYIKARYLAVDTPESTGDIEKWGKTASNFTHDKLADATSIIVESDTEKWNIDSTGERYTLWIWYMPSDGTKYRNLNVEILQNGFAKASATASNRYGETAMAALTQAMAHKLHVFSPASTIDENYYDGEALEVDLQTLRFRSSYYSQKSIRVRGIVTARFDNSVYIEEQFNDEMGNTYYCGMPVYYGYKSGKILNVLSVGNRVEVVGNFTAFSGGWQISGVQASEMKVTEKDCTVVSTGHEPSYAATSAYDIIHEDDVTRTVYFEEKDENGEEKLKPTTISYAESVIATTVTLTDLYVVRYTTTQSGDSKGAMSLICKASDGTQITVRTTVLLDENKVTVTGDMFEGKTITAKGLVDKYTYDYEKNPDDYQYQIKVYKLENLIIQE